MTDFRVSTEADQCLGKVKLEAGIAHKLALKSRSIKPSKRRHRADHVEVTAYKCAHCKAWHVGSKYPKRGLK